LTNISKKKQFADARGNIDLLTVFVQQT